MKDSKSTLTVTGKLCSICGKWHAYDEYSYGKRENRSYCRLCNKEEKAAYALGGVEAARKYREKERATWKKNLEKHKG